MQHIDIWDTQAAQSYDTPGVGMFAPDVLDLMGQLAGFDLESRHADWAGTAFTATARHHVSVYRLG